MLDRTYVYYEDMFTSIPPYGTLYTTADIDPIVKFLKDAVFPTIATVTFDAADKLTISIDEGVPYHHQTKIPYDWETLKTDSLLHKAFIFRTIVFQPTSTLLKSAGFTEEQLSTVTDAPYPTHTDYVGDHYSFYAGYSIHVYAGLGWMPDIEYWEHSPTGFLWKERTLLLRPMHEHYTCAPVLHIKI